MLTGKLITFQSLDTGYTHLAVLIFFLELYKANMSCPALTIVDFYFQFLIMIHDH